MAKKVLIVLFLLLICLSLIVPIIYASSLWDFITEYATTNTNVTIVVSSIVVPFVSQPISQNVTESSSTTLYVWFNASIPNGDYNNINKSSAKVNVSRSGETPRYNETCINYSQGTDYVMFNCTIRVWYWDGAGNWTINASIKDTSGNMGTNTTLNMTLSESTCFVSSPTSLTWATVIPSATNQTSNNDPSLLNNTCNKDIATNGVQLRGLNLHGVTTNATYIGVGNFTVDIETGSSLECIGGTSLVNNSFQAITSSILTAGNNSLSLGNETSGQEQLYYCVPTVPASPPITAQTYSTAYLGPWVLQIL
jgi:hypothetical protein